MWLMMLGGMGMMIAAAMRHYKEKNAENIKVPDLVPGKQNNEKITVSTIQAELVPPMIDRE